MASGSSLLIHEYFQSGDRRLLEELFRTTEEKVLQAFAAKWLDDPRPFAREMLLAYVDDGCDRPHHRPLVKKLFKGAEDKSDDLLLAHFLVAFDRLIPRHVVEEPYYDWTERAAKTKKVLRIVPGLPEYAYHAARVGRFTRQTRSYLQRRAFRWFRRIGRKDPGRYFAAVREALLTYRDAHLAAPEQLLGAWSLIHIGYHGSPILDRTVRGVRLAGGSTLAQLEPAPYCPRAWEGRFEELFHLLLSAPARLVRGVIRQILEQRYAAELAGLDLPRLRRLLTSPHDDLQLFGIERLRGAPGLDAMTIEEWLVLLEIDHPIGLPIVVELFEKHVAPSRLELEQCVKLAQSRTGPVASLGVRWLKTRRVQSEAQIRSVLPLVEARAPNARAEAAAWLIEVLKSAPAARPEHLRDVVDSRFADAREMALPLLVSEARFRDDPLVWAAMAESPYPEMRAFLIDHLEARMGEFRPFTLHHLFASSLLAIHRGGKAKRRVLAQLSARLAAGTDDLPSVAPLFRVALMSVRPAERRSALAAIARAAHRRPSLRDAMAIHFPELRLGPEDAVCR